MNIFKSIGKWEKRILFVVTVILMFAIPQQVHAEESETEVTLYYLNRRPAEVISIPDNLLQSYQLNYSGQNVKYRITDGHSANVSSDGLITPNTSTGDTTIEINADGQLYYVTVHVQDYALIYCHEIMDAYLKENITDTMTDYEKIDMIARFPAQYDYSPLYYTDCDMILYGGGDCVSSTSVIITLCRKLGINAWLIAAVNRNDPGNQHVQPLIELNGLYYGVEAGKDRKRDEKTGLRPYSIWTRTSLYQYIGNNSYDGVLITQYDGRDKLDILEIPETIDGFKVTGISEYGFLSSKYSEIILPDTITEIGDYAFKDSQLTKIHIPATVTSLGSSPFEGCHGLENISIAEDNPSYKVENQTIYTKDGSVLLECPVADEVKIPPTVTRISDFAFSVNYNIRHIDIPASVTELGTGAFNDTLLKTVTIEGNNLTKIEPFCFANSDIEVIRLPASIKALEARAFDSCINLKYIYFAGNAPEFGGIYEDKLLEEVKFLDEVFYGCTAAAYYVEGNPTWSPDVLTDHSGKITWSTYAGGDCRPIKDASLTLDGKEIVLTLDGNILEKEKDYIVYYDYYWVENIPYTKVTALGIGAYDGFLSTSYLTNKLKRNIAASVENSRIEENTTTKVIVTGLENEALECTYSSDNPSVALVNSDGIITGISSGTAWITVTVPETDTYEKATATVKITVTTPTATASPTPKPTETPVTEPTISPDITPELTKVPSAVPTDTPIPVPTKAPDTVPTDTLPPEESTVIPEKPTKAPNDQPSASKMPKVTVGKKVVVKNINYRVTSVKSGKKTVECIGSKKNNESIVIPSTVKVSGTSYKVTSIAKNAFKGNSKLSKITIGANIKNIGKNAFYNCKNLKQIVIKTKKLTTKTVGKNAFKKISNKATVKVPESKVKIYDKLLKVKGAGKQVKVKK